MHNFVYNYREIEYYSEKLWKEQQVFPEIKDCPINHWRTKSEYLSDYVLDYGKDTLSLYEQFVGFEKGSLDEDSYEEKALDGVFNFLKKVARTVEEHKDSILSNVTETEDSYTLRQNMITAFKAPEDKNHPRAYVALLMEYCNQFYQMASEGICTLALVKDYLAFLSVLAPHHGESAWQILNLEGSLFEASWPKVDEQFAKEGEIVIPVQVNGKTKCELSIHRNTGEEEAKEKAIEALVSTGLYQEENLRKARFIYVEGKIVNLIEG